uniref:HAT C-terminal dimerisation domain-containing protein n=1 Tax=Solanum lycopersicum TaxID=4081 RepID=A0A3Q7J6V9_SOLLC
MDGHYIPPSRSLRKNQLSADPHPNLRAVGHATICGLSSWLTPKTHTRRLGKGQDTLVPMERRSDHASWSRDEDQTLKSPASGLHDVFTITVDNASFNSVTINGISKQLTNSGTNIMEGDMFGKEIGESLAGAVDKYMKALFDHYVKKSSKVSLFSSSSPVSSGNSSSISSPDFLFLLRWLVTSRNIPISSVESECAFSTGGRILNPFRSSLTYKLVQALISLQDWYRSEPIPINVEEDLEYVALLELAVASPCAGRALGIPVVLPRGLEA